jgi:hypothetical protein
MKKRLVRRHFADIADGKAPRMRTDSKRAVA